MYRDRSLERSLEERCLRCRGVGTVGAKRWAAPLANQVPSVAGSSGQQLTCKTMT
jgi:hypothetical protein